MSRDSLDLHLIQEMFPLQMPSEIVHPFHTYLATSYRTPHNLRWKEIRMRGLFVLMQITSSSKRRVPAIWYIAPNAFVVDLVVVLAQTILLFEILVADVTIIL